MSQLCEAQENFDFKAEKIEVKKTVNIAIHDFIEKIDDQKKKSIESPKFKVGDNSFEVSVFPQDPMENIGVYLWNRNKEKEKVTVTFTFKHASGVKGTTKNLKLEAGHGKGTGKFLSHEAYKEWAKVHGDVFKVEVEITLHAEKPAQWTSTR